MLKKLVLFFISLFLVFALVNCRENHYKTVGNNGEILVTLVVPQTKGSIDVTDYTIIEAVVTVTAPDGTGETQTWVPGDSLTMTFENKGTGVYNIEVRERDEVNNEATCDTDFRLRDGHNISITIRLGGNIIVDVVTDTETVITDALVFWNKLGSEAEIQNSTVGPGGDLTGGYFVEGVFGKAYARTSDSDSPFFNPLLTFPITENMINVNEFCVEAWGKLLEPTPEMGCGSSEGPYLDWFSGSFGSDRYFYSGLNSNNGLGAGGAYSIVGYPNNISWETCGQLSYSYTMPTSAILGSGEEGEWHHYALVWKIGGFSEFPSTPSVLVYLDGEMVGTVWNHKGNDRTIPDMTGGVLGILSIARVTGPLAIDNIKIWNYAKTDFSDRFVE